MSGKKIDFNNQDDVKDIIKNLDIQSLTSKSKFQLKHIGILMLYFGLTGIVLHGYWIVKGIINLIKLL